MEFSDEASTMVSVFFQSPTSIVKKSYIKFVLGNFEKIPVSGHTHIKNYRLKRQVKHYILAVYLIKFDQITLILQIKKGLILSFPSLL